MVTLRLVSDDEPGPLAQPDPGECVACFLDRMVGTYGCSDRLTWAGLWRDRAAPRASALERRLRSRGGYCDCEVLMNVFARRTWLAAQGTGDDADPEAEPPPCLGVRKGSTRPCYHWI
jgi:Protein of unknown function (DUF2695)